MAQIFRVKLVSAVLSRIGLRHASQVVTMPALSPTMTSGKIAKWTKKAGDKVTSGETIGEVETDKASVDFVFQDEGFIAKFLVKEGAEDVPVGSPVCIVVDEESEIAAAQAAPAPTSTKKPSPTPVPVPAATPLSQPKVAAPVAAPAPIAAPAAVKVTPVVAPISVTPFSSTAVSTNSASGEYLAFERWGLSLTRAGMGAGIARAQRSYTDVFGYSGHDPLPVPDPEDKEKALKAAKAAKA